MSRITNACIILTVFSFSLGAAAIVNIPADYPSIQQGIDATSTGDTVLVQPGTYYENINFNGHNITLGSLFLTTGDVSYISSTVIDGDSSGAVVTIANNEFDVTLTGFTIQNGVAEFGAGIHCEGADATVSHNIITGNEAYQLESGEGGGILCLYSSGMTVIDNVITGNYASGALGGYGAGISCSYSDPLIAGNAIYGNTAGWGGGGIYCYTSNPVIRRNTVTRNRGTVYGGGIYLDNSHPTLINNTFSKNIARWADGGAMFVGGGSNPVISNTICWQDSAFDEESAEIYIDYGNPIFTYSDIEGGWQGNGNIDSDPYFRDPQNDDFHLMTSACSDPYDSPCIDAGDPMIADSLLDCSMGLGTTISDLGGYGGGDSASTGIADGNRQLPENYGLLQNYPNPFNAQTNISYNIPGNIHVTLEVFDLLGRKIQTLVDEFQTPGSYSVTWDGTNEASGIYLYTLRTGNYTQSNRMLLLK